MSFGRPLESNSADAGALNFPERRHSPSYLPAPVFTGAV